MTPDCRIGNSSIIILSIPFLLLICNPYVRELIDSYRLERVVWEFSWLINNNKHQFEFDSKYITEKYRSIFHDPEFIVDDGLDVLLEISFLEINIDKVHKKFFSNDRTPNSQHNIDDYQRSFPRSQDYLDRRLYETPKDIRSLIKEKGKLLDKCFISIDNRSILFDCNYEQLTLILAILEHSIEFYPSTMSNNNPIYSNQSILPNFFTHSYLFSFNLESELMQLLGGSMNKLQTNSSIVDRCRELISTKIISPNLPFQKCLKHLHFSKLLNYNGIYVSMKSDSETVLSENYENCRIFFYVSKEFTQNSLMLDRAAIMKSSLVLLSYVLSIYSKNSTNLDKTKIDEIVKDISKYITSE